jgi:iron complex outermembrane recepter protein
MRRIAAAAALCAASSAWPQATPSPQELVITSPAPQQVSGFGDVPLSKAPFSGVTVDAPTLRDIGATRISDALRLDASVSDSYNSPAYWDMLSVRGYTLDNRYNYRREGLPISAETMVPMDNKERIELLKGTSGIQAGTSAPGGLANYVVKRAPTGNDDTLRAVTASYGNGHSSSLALDLGARFGAHKDFGYRFNAAYEDLNPYTRNTPGHRNLLALAMDWRISPDSKLEWEFERSERQQIGVNAYSLLGNTLPAPVDGKTNLTRRNWSVPGQFAAHTGSVKFTQNVNEDWTWTTSVGQQQLRTDDRLSFAWGGFNALPNGLSFYPDGTYDLYDFRSENERRQVSAIQSEMAGTTTLAGLTHQLTVGVMRSRMLDRLEPRQAWNLASDTQDNPTPTYPNVNRSEYATEIGLKDRILLSPASSLWLGLRHTQFSRSSEQNAPAGSNYSHIEGAKTTPWLALSHEHKGMLWHASRGYGLEQFVTPNSSTTYTNAGEQLGVKTSVQTELGVKSTASPQGIHWNATAFHIVRPLAYDIYDANSWMTTRYLDGHQIHTGLDFGMGWTHRQWTLKGQMQVMTPKLSGVQLHPETVGNTPLNVPKTTFRALAQYRWAELPGLRTSLRLNHEGPRRVLEDGSIDLPAWTTLDLAAHYDTRVSGVRTEWTLAIDNLSDQRYWRESPKQFGHYYLYPGAPRTGRITVRTSF